MPVDTGQAIACHRPEQHPKRGAPDLKRGIVLGSGGAHQEPGSTRILPPECRLLVGWPAGSGRFIRAAVQAHIADLAALADKETARARAEVTRLDNQERKLLTAHYADRITDHIYEEEQRRIRRERAAADQLLRRFELDYDSILETLDVALKLTDNIQAAYLNADPTERRLLNQAFFERIEIDTEDATNDQLAAPFAQIAPPRGHRSPKKPRARHRPGNTAPETQNPRPKGRGFVRGAYGGPNRTACKPT